MNMKDMIINKIFANFYLWLFILPCFVLITGCDKGICDVKEVESSILKNFSHHLYSLSLANENSSSVSITDVKEKHSFSSFVSCTASLNISTDINTLFKMLKTRYGEKKFEKEKSKFDVLKSKRYEELRYLVALEKKIETMKASGVPVDKVFQITIPVNFNVAHRTKNVLSVDFPIFINKYVLEVTEK